MSTPSPVRASGNRLGRLRFTFAAMFGIFLGAVPTHTWPALALISSGIAVVLATTLRPTMPRRVARVLPVTSAAVWGSVFAAICLWELAAWLLGNNYAHPTLSILADPLLRWYPNRALAGFMWLAAGWGIGRL